MTLRTSWLKYLNLSLFIGLCCGSALCFAQLDRGTISGIVTDPSGSVIAGARVTVTNVETGTQSSTVTTGAGLPPFSSLPFTASANDNKAPKTAGGWTPRGQA